PSLLYSPASAPHISPDPAKIRPRPPLPGRPQIVGPRQLHHPPPFWLPSLARRFAMALFKTAAPPLQGSFRGYRFWMQAPAAERQAKEPWVTPLDADVARSKAS